MTASEARSRMVVRPVKVNRTLGPRAILRGFNVVQGLYTEDVRSLEAVPLVEHEEVNVHFFPTNATALFASDESFYKLYEKYELRPDPVAVAEINRLDDGFTRRWPNVVQWPLPGGKYGWLTFRSSYVEEEKLVQVYTFWNRTGLDVLWMGGVPL